MRQFFIFTKAVSNILLLLILVHTPESMLLAQENACRTRLVPVFVTDRDGNTLRNLPSSDLHLQSQGTSMSIISWNPDGRRHRVVILLDLRRSMKGVAGPGFWNAVMAIAQDVASIQSDNAQLALVTFADQVKETIGFSEGNAAVRRRVEEISKDPAFAKRQDKTGTAIFDALIHGFHLLDSPTSADSLLVISDGLDEGSKTKPDDVLAALSVEMVRVFCVQMIDPVVSRVGQDREPSPEPFVDLVQKSGGRVLGPIDLMKGRFSGSQERAELIKSLQEQLTEFYRGILQNDLLTIQWSAGLTKIEPLRLSLSDSAQHQ